MRCCTWVTWYDASFKANTDDRRNGEASVWPTCIRPEYLLIIPNLHENKLYENNYTNTTHSEAKNTDHIPSVEYLGISSYVFSLAFAAFPLLRRLFPSPLWVIVFNRVGYWSVLPMSPFHGYLGEMEWSEMFQLLSLLSSGLLRRVACELFFWRSCGCIAGGTIDLRIRMRQRFYRCLSYFSIYMVFWIFRRPISHEAHWFCDAHCISVNFLPAYACGRDERITIWNAAPLGMYKTV